MKYTKGNITGITFTTGVSEYIILGVKEESIHLVKPETGWEDFTYPIDGILTCLNNGAYREVINSPKNIPEYETY